MVEGMRLQGRTAIVTGGASGFGAGIARKFFAEGARVMVANLNLDAAKTVATEVGGYAQACDASDVESVRAMKDEPISQFGKLDIMVNNACVTPLPCDPEDVQHFKENGGGVVLNVASTGGVCPRPRLTWYNASKGWMITATKGMAVELAPFGIRVNAINPVARDSPLLKSFMGEDTPEIPAKFLATNPIGRFSTPEDMGNAACFRCSDEASMITGVAMEVDGGRCI